MIFTQAHDNETWKIIITLEFAEFITPTLITRDVAQARAFAAEAPGRVVVTMGSRCVGPTSSSGPLAEPA